VLRRALSSWLTGPIEHIGSTAIPGLVAKPTIDIMGGVATLEASRPAIEAAAEVGYCYAPYRVETEHWFCKPSPAVRRYHLHLLPVDAAAWLGAIAFRDYLRTHDEAAREYELLKRRLAEEHRLDREAYTRAKQPFIERITSIALEAGPARVDRRMAKVLCRGHGQKVSMWWRPELEGTVSIQSASGPFMRAFATRVESGLLTGRPHPRSNYVWDAVQPDQIRVRATDWWTAINVGLNRLDLRPVPPDRVHYAVRYWQWAQYALGLSGAMGLTGLALLLGTDARGYIERNPNSMMPGLSVEQNLGIAWVMVLFWGFVWPWLLIAMHKRPLRRLVTRLIAEVDTRAASQTPSAQSSI
jgi:GrpB-like predicted nucleotidyltransferase (UPF0157 family)